MRVRCRILLFPLYYTFLKRLIFLDFTKPGHILGSFEIRNQTKNKQLNKCLGISVCGIFLSQWLAFDQCTKWWLCNCCHVYSLYNILTESRTRSRPYVEEIIISHESTLFIPVHPGMSSHGMVDTWSQARGGGVVSDWRPGFWDNDKNQQQTPWRIHCILIRNIFYPKVN